ncbi:RDD family protein [Belliella sp. DSM 111904]|uniref:RDD family protein n=1 Tax=Belliella filtrata TaxID=2923435 RepID=A0ABS9V6C5_9BACT|nr:RDD family protein [Belliella filtrata]MCH7411774.1 RDD family protein [Belliella filtrata]
MNFKYRIANFFIDMGCYLIFSLAIIFLTKEIIDVSYVRDILLGVYFLYYFCSELFFGKTIGKAYTKTKVVDKNTLNKPKFYQILIRSLLRGLPFYFISYFISEKGLHDHLSQTILIKS